jgi:hypothetical protein
MNQTFDFFQTLNQMSEALLDIGLYIGTRGSILIPFIIGCLSLMLFVVRRRMRRQDIIDHRDLMLSRRLEGDIKILRCLGAPIMVMFAFSLLILLMLRALN